jgi:radical SAM peptide maturase (CXXX-repeat target family)/CXXX repeat peptide maturase
MCGKNDTTRMTSETGKRIIDFILEQDFEEDSVIFDFIGGEPLLEIELIDEIMDYAKLRMYELNHKWQGMYNISISTNGTLYHLGPVQKFIKKNHDALSLGFSVDGNKAKHDGQRIYPNGKGSYDDVVANVPLWLAQFPNESTKATFAKGDLIHLKDSVISLWNLGIKVVMANLVFDDYWTIEDAEVYESQLKALADYVLDNNLEGDNYVRFFDKNIGFPVNEELKKKNFCGAGVMLAFDTTGNMYPCIRFLEFTLNDKKSRCIGSIDTGFDHNRIRAFKALTYETQSPKKCLDCEIASGCAWCTGQNYDDAKTDTIYERSTGLCKMHRANVNACEYFWNQYSEKHGVENPRELLRKEKEAEKNKCMLIMMDSQVKPHCNYHLSPDRKHEILSEDLFSKAIAYSEKYGYLPILMSDGMNRDELTQISSNKDCDALINISINEKNDSQNAYKTIIVDPENVADLYEVVLDSTSSDTERINIILRSTDSYGDTLFKTYKSQLIQLKDWILEKYEQEQSIPKINVLSDALDFEESGALNCDSGSKTITLAPDGLLYTCPGFYHNGLEAIGNLTEGVTQKNIQLFERENAPICKQCDSTSCRRCKLQAALGTLELNVPTQNQCKTNQIELEVARELQLALIQKGHITQGKIISARTTYDPLDNLLDNVKNLRMDC